MNPQRLRIGVAVDWIRSARGNGWAALLADINHSGLMPNVCELYSLADLILATPDAQQRFLASRLDVLIINWDAANGDPEFGSHLTQSWLAHRRPELLLWVRQGGLLIVEGQATLSVPSQPAYDALLGANELLVCGWEDAQNPLAQRARLGSSCRPTKLMPKRKGFELLPPTLTVLGHPTRESLFPDAAARLLTVHISDTDWGNVLYRGWFRRRLWGRGALPWVTLASTNDRRRGGNHSVLEVAKVGEGAIFATTMFLATTDQRLLVRAMLACFKDTAHLPDPVALDTMIRQALKMVLPALAGFAVGFLTDAAAAVLAFFGQPASGNGTLTTVVKALFVPLGLLLFEGLLRLWRAARKRLADFVGD